MKTAVYNTFNRAIEIKQVDNPVLAKTEVIIEGRASGICHLLIMISFLMFKDSKIKAEHERVRKWLEENDKL